jgi:hypothetical protein
MVIYRFLSGEDDSSFCHKVTKALSEGWLLYGITCSTRRRARCAAGRR